MFLLYGVSCLGVFALSIAVMLIICRNPNASEWLSNALTMVLLPVMMGVAFAGFALLHRYALAFADQPLNITEIALSAGVAVAVIVSIKALRVKRRLAAYLPVETRLTLSENENIIELASHPLANEAASKPLVSDRAAVNSRPSRVA